MPTIPRSVLVAAVIALSPAAPAWSAPPPLTPAEAPPARVGRVARLDGTVFYHPAGADHWSPAILNLPVTTGDAFWTEPQARADIQVASDRIVLAPGTELDVTTLDDQTVKLTQPQGELFLDLRGGAPGGSDELLTPRGTLQLATPGRYAVTAGDADHPTTVSVIDGAAQITSPGLSLAVAAQTTATLTGPIPNTNPEAPTTNTVSPLALDPFASALAAAERPAPRPPRLIPPQVARMTGSEDLQSQGEWQQSPEYGAVWYPPVTPGWVPYRQGRWSYVAPWGWTWVDDAPWGFAPFHYGRWVEAGERWGWIPSNPAAEPALEPVYAPALVSFISLTNLRRSYFERAYGRELEHGFGPGRHIGWVPLGPREPYDPPYSRNLRYIQALNRSTLHDTATLIASTNRVSHTFINRAGATVAPASALAASTPLAGMARALRPEQLRNATTQFTAPVIPTAATIGVTQAVARRFNFTPAARPLQPLAGPVLNRPTPFASPTTPAFTTPRFATPATELPHVAFPSVETPRLMALTPAPFAPRITVPTLRAIPSPIPAQQRPTAPLQPAPLHATPPSFEPPRPAPSSGAFYYQRSAQPRVAPYVAPPIFHPAAPPTRMAQPTLAAIPRLLPPPAFHPAPPPRPTPLAHEFRR